LTTTPLSPPLPPSVKQVEMLAFLSSVAKGVPQKLEVMSQLVSSLFDLSPGISSYMKVGLWKRSMSVMLEIMDLLNTHGHIILDDTGEWGGVGERGR